MFPETLVRCGRYIGSVLRLDSCDLLFSHLGFPGAFVAVPVSAAMNFQKQKSTSIDARCF